MKKLKEKLKKVHDENIAMLLLIQDYLVIRNNLKK
jgi:hypothetical protein